MNTNSNLQLSKSNVDSLNFKKSPIKYTLGQSKTGQTNFGYSSTNLDKKQWSVNQFGSIKKVSDDVSSLRQTFDTRGNTSIREKLAKYDFQDQDPTSYSNKADAILRQTFHTKISSPIYKDLTSSSVNDQAYKKEELSSYQQRKKDYAIRSPVQRKIAKEEIQEKFKKYVEASDNIKGCKQKIQATSKMNEQLKKLKQDRKRRLEAKEKQLSQLEKKLKRQDTNETFKKKAYYDSSSYTPKQQKSSYQERFHESTKFANTTLDISKYKSSINQEQFAQTSYKSPKKDNYKYNKEPKSAITTYETKKVQNNGKTSEMEIGDFILGKTLGEGKFGVVYQAFHKPTGWLYALKKIPKEMIRSHLMIDQFILELKLQTFLNHENILTLFHHFDDHTSIYLVLEYMEEGTLFSQLKKRKTIEEKQVAKKIKQITSAVKYLHENTIAHRDIKPQNIVLSHGICKLCDFGWSTICDDRRKTYCGTFDYAPPEILQGVQYDYTVDLWCLGILTYQLLVGKAPFYHISRKQTMKKIMNVENENIQYPENISENARSFINGLIKKDPKERISSDIILEHPFLRYADDKN